MNIGISFSTFVPKLHKRGPPPCCRLLRHCRFSRAPIIAKNFPNDWQRWRAAEIAHAQWAGKHLDRMAAGAVLDGAELVAAVKANTEARRVSPVESNAE